MNGYKEEAKGPCRKLAVVVGAGVAGVQAARALLRAGFDALILEQGRGIGGVWRRNYHSFALQVPWPCYTFPEFHYDKAPSEIGEKAKREGFPSGNTVQEYIAAYCAHFDLERHIIYGAKVVHLSAQPTGRWTVRFRQAAPNQPLDRGALKIMEADVVVLATGMYYSPYVPAVAGLAFFKGRVLHARDFTSTDGLQGKRVLVLGAGKSAHDCAVVAASPAAGTTSVTTLFRQAHWPLPRVLFGIPFHKLVYTRFTAAMLPMYYTGQGRPVKQLKHALLSPLKRLFWATLERHVANKMRLRGSLRPEAGFVEDLFFGGQIQDGSWNEAVNAGRIQAVQGSLAEIMPAGVRLNDGTLIECDVIIFATGYAKDYSLFDAATASRLMNACPGAEGLHLYRSILSPWVPNLYFIGSEASTFNNVLTSGLQSLWMMHHLLGSIKLPSSTEMVKDIQDQRSWRQGVMPPQHYSASAIMLYQQRYHDQLVADMRHDTRRKRARGRGGSEFFGVYTAEDYAEIFHDAAVPQPTLSAAPAAPIRSAAQVVDDAVTLMPAAAAIGARLDLAVLPTGGGGGGARAGQRQGGLLPVCTAHSGTAAIAVAPGVATGDSGPNCVAAAQTALGMANSFMGSFDSPIAPDPARRGGPPAPAPPAAAGQSPAGTTSTAAGGPPDRTKAVPAATGAAGGARSGPPPPSAAQLPDSVPTALEAPDTPQEDTCDEPVGPQDIMAGLDTTADTHPMFPASTVIAPAAEGGTVASTPTRTTPAGGAGAAAGSANPISRISPATSGAVGMGTTGGVGTGGGGTGSGAGDSTVPSAFSTSAAMAGASVAGNRHGAGAPAVIPLIQRVKLQVLHLFDRSPGGTLMPVMNSSANGEGEILEFNLNSNTVTSNRKRESSITATSQAIATAGGGMASGSLCADTVRHAAPNVYGELVNTLEVH